MSEQLSPPGCPDKGDRGGSWAGAVGSHLLEWGEEGWDLQVEQELWTHQSRHPTAGAAGGWGYHLYRISPVLLFALCAHSWQALGAEHGEVPVWLPVCHKRPVKHRAVHGPAQKFRA